VPTKSCGIAGSSGHLNAPLKPTIRRYVCANENENKFPFGTSFYAAAAAAALFAPFH